MTTPDDIALPEPYDILAEIHGDELAAEEVEVPVFTADQLRTAVLEDRKRREAVKKDFCNTAKGQNVTDETERAYREAHGIAAQEGKTE